MAARVLEAEDVLHPRDARGRRGSGCPAASACRVRLLAPRPTVRGAARAPARAPVLARQLQRACGAHREREAAARAAAVALVLICAGGERDGHQVVLLRDLKVMHGLAIAALRAAVPAAVVAGGRAARAPRRGGRGRLLLALLEPLLHCSGAAGARGGVEPRAARGAALARAPSAPAHVQTALGTRGCTTQLKCHTRRSRWRWHPGTTAAGRNPAN